jgi:hypothetical protein
MSHPRSRRNYELMSFVLNAIAPVVLVVVGGVQHIQLLQHNQEIEELRAELATIRLNLATPTDVKPTYGSSPSSTANTSK